jgi:NAD+ diphosphatase
MKPNNRLLLNFFDADSIDRMAEKRKDKTWLLNQLEDPDTRIVPIWRDMNLVSVDSAGLTRAAFPDFKQFSQVTNGLLPDILLGKDKRTGLLYFALELPENDETIPMKLSPLGEFKTLRDFSINIQRHHASLLAYARGIVIWHRNHLYCGRCGSSTHVSEGGHVRVCNSSTCNRHHFPRTDPAVIVLVSCGDKCLLAHAPRWPKEVYSTIAGFVEPGESLELAVAREVMEETAVQVDPRQVVYHSSQPWPFPASIMLGFTVETHYQDIRIDTNELEDAQWFSRQQIDEGLAAGTFRLPTKYSIANRLIQDWRDKL